MARMLVGIDGSEASRAALKWAAAVSKATSSPLHLLWAWQYPARAVLSVGALDLPGPRETADLVEEDLQRLVKELLGDDTDRVTVQAGAGPAVTALLDAARQQASMIVVGSRGLGGFKGLLLGSASRQLCEHAPCPVTVVRSETLHDPVELRTIVAGTDGSVDGQRALRFAGRLARRVGAELVVANTSGPDVALAHGLVPSVDQSHHRDVVEQWCAPLRQDDVPYRIETREGDARVALPRLAREQSADLLVVGGHGHGPVGRLLMGSVAASLVQHSEIPITVVPPARSDLGTNAPVRRHATLGIVKDSAKGRGHVGPFHD